MSDVFISYKSEDRDSAELLAVKLERAGFSIFWDRNIIPGATFDLVLSDELEGAKCIVVLWTAKSIRSNWVREEAQRAASRGVLVPVLIENVTPPLGFGLIEAAKLIDWRADESDLEYCNLLKAVSAHAKITETAAGTTVLHRARSTRRWLRPSALAALAVALAAITVALWPRQNCDAVFRTAIEKRIRAATDAQEAEARELFEQASACRNDLAQMWIARTYFKGQLGAPQDPQKGQLLARQMIARVEKQADKGNLDAMFLVGAAYQDGLGVANDPQRAIELFTTAADRGYALAQWNLGVAHQNGQIVAKDDTKARQWLTKAAEQGATKAAFELGIRAYEAGEYEESAASFRKAAALGHPLAQVKMGDIFSRGQGVPQDNCQACQWYKNSADLGSPEGQVELGLCYYSGNGCKAPNGALMFARDRCKAVDLFRSAAERGNVQGLFNIGLALVYGDCEGRKDAEAGKRYLERAALGGSSEAKQELQKITAGGPR